MLSFLDRPGYTLAACKLFFYELKINACLDFIYFVFNLMKLFESSSDSIKTEKNNWKKRKVRHKSCGPLWDDLDEMSGLLTHLFVTTVTCIDPSCSGNGLCHLGKCVCYKGFKGDHCQLPDKLNLTHLCARDCSGHGQFDWDTGQCICQRFFTGKDCEKGKGSCLKIPRLTQFFVALTYFCQSWTQ